MAILDPDWNKTLGDYGNYVWINSKTGEVSQTEPTITQEKQYADAEKNRLGARWQSTGDDSGSGSWINDPSSALAADIQNTGGQLFYGNAYGSLNASNDLASRILAYDPKFQLSDAEKAAAAQHWNDLNKSGGLSHSDFGGGDSGGVTKGTAAREEETSRVRMLEQMAKATGNPTLQKMYAEYIQTQAGKDAIKLANKTADYQQKSGTMADAQGLMIPLSVGMGAMALGNMGFNGLSGGFSGEALSGGSGLVDGLGAASYGDPFMTTGIEGYGVDAGIGAGTDAGAASFGTGVEGYGVDAGIGAQNYAPMIESGSELTGEMIGNGTLKGAGALEQAGLGGAEAAGNAAGITGATAPAGLLDAIKGGAKSVADWAKANPWSAASLGITAAGLISKATTPTGTGNGPAVVGAGGISNLPTGNKFTQTVNRAPQALGYGDVYKGGTPFFNQTYAAAQGGPVPAGLASIGNYAGGGRLLKGQGDGLSDSIPARINGTQEARLADGEFVIPADIVSALGGGSTDAGSKRLYSMLARIRKQAHGSKQQIRPVNDKALPA